MFLTGTRYITNNQYNYNVFCERELDFTDFLQLYCVKFSGYICMEVKFKCS